MLWIGLYFPYLNQKAARTTEEATEIWSAESAAGLVLSWLPIHLQEQQQHASPAQNT